MIPQEYIASFAFDQRLAPYDILGSIAHVKMLARCRILRRLDAKKIIHGLQSIQKDLDQGWKIPWAEDIHFAIENELVKRIGETGKKMHTARSRNDQVVLDVKLYLKDQSRLINGAIAGLQKSLLDRAVEHKNTLMPGMTHLQHGQPIFFAHHLLAYAWMFERDRERFKDAARRCDSNPLGACALAGTALPIDRAYTAKLLGFDRVTENAMDTVSDRDFMCEFNFNCALSMIHLSRLAEDLVIWSSQEFQFVRLAEEHTSGSSIMPQKRNPDTAELLRGKTGRAIGNLVQMLTLLKNLPLSYNRDLQEDKVSLFDSVDVTLISLQLAADIINKIAVNKAKMAESCQSGFLTATELADYLAGKGVPFRKAHSIISKMVDDVTRNSGTGGSLGSLSLTELKTYSPLFTEEAKARLSSVQAALSKNSPGGTGKNAIARQIQALKNALKK